MSMLVLPRIFQHMSSPSAAAVSPVLHNMAAVKLSNIGKLRALKSHGDTSKLDQFLESVVSGLLGFGPWRSTFCLKGHCKAMKEIGCKFDCCRSCYGSCFMPYHCCMAVNAAKYGNSWGNVMDQIANGQLQQITSLIFDGACIIKTH